MSQSASIDLIFNAKNNTKAAFGDVEKQLRSTGKSANGVSTQFVKLGQSIEGISKGSASRLKQSFDSIESASSRLFAASQKGFSLFVSGFETSFKAALEFAKVIGKISDELSKSRGFLDGESVGAVLAKNFEEASKEATTFREILSGLAFDATKIGAVSARASGQAAAGFGNATDNVTTFVAAITGAAAKLGELLDVAKEVSTKAFEVPEQIGQGFAVAGGALRAAAGYDEALATFDGLKQAAGGFADTIGQVSQQIFFFQSAFSSISQIAASGPFKLLIGQQVELRQQLLETQSTLVATNKIIDNFSGKQLNLPTDQGGDPGQAIVALTGATQAAIDQLRKDSLDLVGVTSRELSEVFNITTTNLASIGIETDNILGDAADLTIKFSAALGTIGLPLFQARQEITSILQGTIDNNSALAKTLGLTSEQVNKYKEQGNLIDKLNEKLAPFAAGNAIAAKSLSGVTSNLTEIFEIVALQAGKPLLDPILEDLGKLFNFLSAQQNAFVRFLEPVIVDIDRIRAAVTDAATSIGTQLGGQLAKIPVGIINSAANFVEQLAIAIGKSLTVLSPLISLLDPLLDIFVNLSNGFGQTIIQFIVFGKVLQLLTKTLRVFTNLVPGVGEAFAVLGSGTEGVVAQFVKARSAFGSINGLVVTAGLNFDKLAQAIPAVQQNLASSLGGFKFLAPVLTGLIPKISLVVLFLGNFAKELKGLGDGFVASIPKFQAFIARTQAAGRVIAVFAAKFAVGVATIKTALSNLGLGEASAKLDNLVDAFKNIAASQGTRGLDDLGKAVQGFVGDAEKGLKGLSETGQGVSKKLFGNISAGAIKAAVSFGLWAIAIAGASIAFSEFIQRRKDAGDEIRGVGEALERETAALRGLTDVPVDELGSKIKDSSKLTKDWIDKIILLDREFSFADLSFENFGETIISVGKVILVVLTRLAAGIGGIFQTAFVTIGTFIGEFFAQTVATFLDSFGVIGRILQRAIKGDLGGALDEIKNFGTDAAGGYLDVYKNVGDNLKEGGKQILDGFTKGLSETKTKVEEETEEIADALAGDDFLDTVREFGDEIRETLVPGDLKFKEIGTEISKSLSTIGDDGATAAARLGAIAESARLVQEAGKTGLIDEAVVKDSLAQLEDFKNAALTTSGELKDSSESGKEAFNQQAASLRQALSIGLQQGRSGELEERADQIQRELNIVEETLKTLEERQIAGATVPQEAIDNARKAKIELEALGEIISGLRQDTTPLPDPVQLYLNSLQKNEAILKREQSKIVLEQQQSTQDAVFGFLEKRNAGELVFARDLERDKAKIQQKGVEDELKGIQEAVAEIVAVRETLNDSELERAQEADDQLRQLQTRQAQKQIELYDLVLAEQQRVREEAERGIAENLKLLQNAITSTTLSLKDQQLEYDKINKTIEFQNQILDEGKKLVEAQTQSAVSGLEFLQQTAKGQARQKTLTEATAAIRLQSVKEQLKFDEISLRLEQQKTQLALEREAIASRIATLEAEASLASAQADLEKINLPGSEATAGERKAAEISVRAAAGQLKASQQAEGLIQQQIGQQAQLFAIQNQAAAQQRKNQLNQAERAFVQAIPGARGRQASRELQLRTAKETAASIGLDPNSFSSIAEFTALLDGANRNFERSQGFGGGGQNQLLPALEAIIPAIGDLTGEARDQAIEQALRKLGQADGEFPLGLQAQTAPSNVAFNLGTSQQSLLAQAFSPVQNTLGLAATGLGKAAEGFETLVSEIRAIAAKPTYAITVAAGGQAATATGVGSGQGADLQRVLATAKRLVSNGLF